MKAQRSKNDQNRLSTAQNRETVLTNWTDAITTFKQHYNDLGCYVSANHQFAYVGQCPMGDLITTLIRMHDELENLVLDLDEVDQTTILHKITDHTVTLNQLNHQAKTALHLAGIPAS